MNISVVLATYNGAKFIRKQLNSIINQTVTPDEIIISDDCSTDNTWEILQEYKLNYPALIYIERNNINLGYAANFWKVLGEAKGKIIFLSDQDDLWYPNKIEKCIQVLNDNLNVLALSTSYSLINEHDIEYKDIRNVRFNNNRNIQQIKWEEFIIHPKYPGMAMAVRKSLIDKILINDVYNIPPHDWLLNQYAALEGGMYFYDIVLSQYRQHQGNVVGSSANNHVVDSKKRRIQTISDMQRTLEIQLDIFRKDKMNIERINFMERINEICKKRITLIVEEKFMNLILYDIKNIKYLSIRSILGDLYTGIRIKNERGIRCGSHNDGDL